MKEFSFDLAGLSAFQQQPGQSWRVSRILQASLQAVEPGRLVARSLTVERDSLSFPDGRRIPLDDLQQIYLVGIGKAALPMVEAAAEITRRLDARRIAVTKGEPGAQPSGHPSDLRILPAGHPQPDQRSLQAGREVRKLLEGAGEHDLVVVLLSGGGSSLLCQPAEPLGLDELILVNQLLLTSGADIREINTVRKHLSRIKGGQLARIAQPARLVTLILSDVIGNPLDAVASGPTVPDPTRYQDALEVLEKYRLTASFPTRAASLLQAGARGELPETPKPGEPIFHTGQTHLVGSNRTAALAALEQARRERFQASVLTTHLQGEARSAGVICGSILQEMATSGDPLPRPACLILGGETTVTIASPGTAGQGGRNLEAALAAVPHLDRLKEAALITLATDGQDGLTPAAGAVVTGCSQSRAREQGLDAARHLNGHDAYPFFKKLGDLICTGKTLTNVNDLWFLFTFEEEVR